MTVIAPNISTYSSHAPYITPAEYLASPTGVNVSQLVPRGTEDQNKDALRTVISRASAYADAFCKQVLNATVEVTSGRYRLQRTGIMRVPLTYSPALAIESIQVGFSPSQMTALTDMGNVWLDRKVVTFPIGSTPILPVFGATAPDGYCYVIVEYVNGYANSELTAPSVIGATSVTVASTVGMYPGVELTINDPGNTESVIISSVSGNVVSFTTPLVFAHEAGNNISALPDSIKQAIVLLTSALIKTRGSEAVVMSQLRQQANQTTSIEGGGFDEVSIAKSLLLPYVRTV